MSFHFNSETEAKAAVYDACILLLNGERSGGIPLHATTVQDLQNICWRISNFMSLEDTPFH